MNISLAPLFTPNSESSEIVVPLTTEALWPEEWKDIFIPTMPFTGTARIIRVKDDVLVFLQDGKIKGKVRCGKCLQDEEISLVIPNAEQIFYSTRKEELGEEEFFIDQKNKTIDVDPFVRQEITIHIPLNFQHSPGKCDPQMLQKIADFIEKEEESPFQELKKLLKEPKTSRQKRKN